MSTEVPESPTERLRFRERVRGWIGTLMTMERREPFTRPEQLWMVLVAHLIILVGVIFIMRTPFIYGDRLDRWPPGGFWVCEAIILIACVVPMIPGSAFSGAMGKMIGFDALKQYIEDHGEAFARRLQGRVLLLLYLLQFVAFYVLLDATGGPIDSPFSPMALAIAIFTPFIVNKAWTTAVIVLTTITYYAVFVGAYGFEACVPEPAALAKAVAAHVPPEPLCEIIRPQPGAFVAVNVLILVLSTVLTFQYKSERERPAT